MRAWLPLLLALLIFCGLAAYQLDLPGLHYDEAKEAGLNAMQMLTGRPLSLFRGAGLHLFGLTLPTMVQDYIGALNVYLALPFLALGGVNVPALRALPIVCAALTLIFLYHFAAAAFNRRTAGLAALLLAVNPSFVFWSRQGILVTNITCRSSQFPTRLHFSPQGDYSACLEHRQDNRIDRIFELSRR